MKYIFLGILQGFTEFLPISSSAHLMILQELMHFNSSNLKLIIFAHLGTVLALLFYFFKEIRELLSSLRLLKYVLIVTLVTALIGILFKRYFELLFESVWLLKFTLIINGIIILLTYFFSKSVRTLSLFNLKDVVGLGIVQGLAIIPGISRSGITISYLLLRNLNKEEAFKFSFLIGIPAVLGAFILEIERFSLHFQELNGLLLCMLASFLSGLFSLAILKRLIHKTKFHYFGYYCIIIGLFLFFIK